MLRQVLIPISRHLSSQTRLRFASSGVINSPHSIDKLYPNSNPDYASKPKFDAEKYVEPRTDGKEPFTGYIPPDSLQFTYSRSGGAGGQHVNKVSTKVEIRFHVESATWIPDWIKPRLLEKERNRITKDGYFVISSDRTRKQLMNQADCMEKIRAAVRQAAVVSEATEEDMAVLKQREEKSKQHALKEKRMRSLKKQRRQSPSVADT